MAAGNMKAAYTPKNEENGASRIKQKPCIAVVCPCAVHPSYDIGRSVLTFLALISNKES